MKQPPVQFFRFNAFIFMIELLVSNFSFSIFYSCMIWVDREAKKIADLSRGEWVDDMKTPSGRIHVGSLRGVMVHDLVYKALKGNGVKTRFSYVFNDMDPMDALPHYLDRFIYEKYMGFPLIDIPSPEKGFDNYARYFAYEFINVFNSLNCYPEIIWSSELYHHGLMNDVIKLILDNSDKIREIYKRVAKAERSRDWYPFNPICEQCGKIGTTNVYKWDGTHIYYRCEPNMVKWAQGCGYEGKTTPYDGHGKLPWKLDWPAHWKVIGVTVEGSGKDHMSSGGSYDMASAFCKEVLGTKQPYAIPYEWFTIGGRKMSSSKGIGSSAVEVSRILPPDVFRFLLVRTPITTHLDFNPYGDTIPNLFDDYDRCMEAYFLKLEHKIPSGKQGEVMQDFARIIELSDIQGLPSKRMLLPRFRIAVHLIQNKSDVQDFFEKQKKAKLDGPEQKILDERIEYANIFLENYAAKSQTNPSQDIFTYTADQKKFLSLLVKELENTKTLRADYQKQIQSIIQNNGFKPKDLFQGLYRALLGNDYGPKAADLIMRIGIENTIEKMNAVLERSKQGGIHEEKNHLFPVLNDPTIFSISNEIKNIYPSIVIGIAIIKNVDIQKSDDELQHLIDEFVTQQSDLTNELISSYPEVQSYRKLYKQMKIDWHSRRPSPEALLRRIVSKKKLYLINTCVDSYNLVVMKNRVSVGAFNLDQMKFPTMLRFPKPGEKIILLGEKEPTEYKATELGYFDRNKGYNIDFNYRDSQETAVTEKTKNILINVDGVYGISRELVEKTLKDSIEQIIKYCSGTIDVAGIVTSS